MSFTSWLRNVRSALAPTRMDRKHQRQRSLRAARPSFFRPDLEDLEDRCMPSTNPALAQGFGALPLRFEANQGQADAAVQFLARGSGYALWLSADEAMLILPNPAVATAGDAEAPFAASGSTLRMRIVGGNSSAQGTALEQLGSRSNYFIGNDPSRWQTNVANYARVEYQDVYPGIDLVYYGNQQQLEYDFVVAPGADPGVIALGFDGSVRLEIDSQGDLVLHTGGDDVRQHKPHLYQEADGVRHEVAGGYELQGQQVGFRVGAYDPTRPLLIDPVVSYATYLGGEFYDSGNGVAVDVHGNIYVTGNASENFLGTSPPLGTHGEGPAFVLKLDPTGTRVLYSTYLGGQYGGAASAIAVYDPDPAAAGDEIACVTGGAGPDFPTTVGAYQRASNDGDPFVAQLNANGNLVYSTFLGGSEFDETTAIAVDRAGNAYVTGRTYSPDFPGTPVRELAGQDAFVAKLNPAGTQLVYATLLGGIYPVGFGGDVGYAIAVHDPDPNTSGDETAYVTGSTTSQDFPTTNPLQGALRGETNAFVTKLNATGSAFVYSTYLGGNGFSEGYGIAVDATGAAYVTGITSSDNFPVANALQAHNGGGSFDAFVAKLNPTGSALAYSTYLGGGGGDSAAGIAVDAAGAAYVTGFTESRDFPLAAPTQSAFAGPGYIYGTDAFVTVLSRDGTGLVYSSYLGGDADDIATAIALDAAGNIYLTGHTNSDTFPTHNPLQPALVGSSTDAFVAKITGMAANQPPTTTGIPPFTFNDTPKVELDLRGYFDDAEDGAAGLTYTVSANTNHGLVNTIRVDDFDDHLQLGFAPGMFGTADLTIRATDSGGLLAQATFTVSVQAAPKARFDWSVPDRFGPDRLKLALKRYGGIVCRL